MVHLSHENHPARWDHFHVYFDAHVLGVQNPYVDKAGNIFLYTSLEEGSTLANVMVILDPAGKEKRRIKMFVPASGGGEEVWREVRVSPDGKIYQMVLDDQGVTVRRYDP